MNNVLNSKTIEEMKIALCNANEDFDSAIKELMTGDDRLALMKMRMGKVENVDYFSETLLKAYYHLEYLMENKHNLTFVAGIHTEQFDFSDDYNVDVEDSVFDKTVNTLSKAGKYYDYIVEYKFRKDALSGTGRIEHILEYFIEIREQLKNKIYDFDYNSKEDYEKALVKMFINDQDYMKYYAILFFYLQEFNLYSGEGEKMPEIQSMKLELLKSLSKDIEVQVTYTNNKIDLTGAINFKNLFKFEENNLISDTDFNFIIKNGINIVITSYDEVKKRQQTSRLTWNKNLNAFVHKYEENKMYYEPYEPYHEIEQVKTVDVLNELINKAPKNKIFDIYLK